jgi:hypothetical protein
MGRGQQQSCVHRISSARIGVLSHEHYSRDTSQRVVCTCVRPSVRIRSSLSCLRDHCQHRYVIIDFIPQGG